MILLIDNYDSFVHTLARYVRELGHVCEVARNDALTPEKIDFLSPRAIIVSPGPCTPAQAGISVEVIRQCGRRIPILGVCLGHQCIAAAYGAQVVRAAHPIHGKQSRIYHDGKGIFDGLPNPLPAGRYHSLSVRLDPACALRATAFSEDGEIMALEHESLPLWGVQFHPESVLTEGGHRLLENFFHLADMHARVT